MHVYRSHHLLQLLHQLLYLRLINGCSAHMAATLLLRLTKRASSDLQHRLQRISA
jgi:hypothetical protein